MRGRSWTTEEEKKLIEFYNTATLTYEQIGDELGRSLDSVQHRVRKLRKAGILDYRNPNRIKNKYEKDLTNVIRLTPAGVDFITTVLCDGYLQKRHICFGFRKRDCVEFRDIICYILGITPPLHISWRKVFAGRKWYDCGYFTIYSVELAALLAYTYGVPMGAKSGLVILPRRIMKSTDAKIHGAVLRAAYECEGSVNLKKKSLQVIIGNTSILFLQDLAEILDMYTIKNEIYGYRMKISALDSVLKFYEMAYSVFDLKLHITAKKSNLMALIERKTKKRPYKRRNGR